MYFTFQVTLVCHRVLSPPSLHHLLFYHTVILFSLKQFFLLWCLHNNILTKVSNFPPVSPGPPLSSPYYLCDQCVRCGATGQKGYCTSLEEHST